MPNDTITEYRSLTGNTTVTVVSGNSPKTILGVSMQQSKDLSDTWLICGNDILAKNYAKDLPYVPLNFQCANDIKISKTGNDESSVIINYVPYFTSAFSTSTQYGYNPTNNIASSTDVQVYGAISAGEIVISLLLIFQLFIAITAFVIKSIWKISTQKTYIEYSNADVPINKNF
jgi:hypothetical protein